MNFFKVSIISILSLIMQNNFVENQIIVSKNGLIPRSDMHWRVGNLSHVSCPIRDPYKAEHNFTEKTYILSDDVYRKRREGLLCHKMTYKITCTTGFFGGKTITKSISFPLLTPEECERQIESDKVNGKGVDPYFPGENCVWFDTSFNEKTYITTEKHSALVDPYKASYIDSLFISGQCWTKTCHTIHSNIIWSTSLKPNAMCPGYYDSSVGIIYKGEHIFYAVEDHRIYNSEQCCKMIFCSIMGVVLPNGYFFHLFNKSKDALLLPKTVCPETTTVREVTHQTEIDFEKLSLTYLNARLNCLNALTLAKLTNTYSLTLLSNLVPGHSGPGRAYRINRGRLEYADVFYERATKVFYYESLDTLFGNNRYNHLSTFYSTYTHVNDTRTISFFNNYYGIWEGGFLKIIDMDLELTKEILREELSITRSLVNIDHPSIITIKNRTDDIEINIENNSHKGNINLTNIKNWFTSATGIVSTILTLILIGIIFVLLYCFCNPFYLCFRMCLTKFRCKRRHNRTPDNNETRLNTMTSSV